MLYLGIMIAGGLGALLRYGFGRIAINFGWAALPFGTLAANLLGCFLIGYLSWSLGQKWSFSHDNQAIVITGFLGGFTTFSAFSLETVSMIHSGMSIKAAAYVGATVTLCIVMCMLGLALAKQT